MTDIDTLQDKHERDLATAYREMSPSEHFRWVKEQLDRMPFIPAKQKLNILRKVGA